MSNSSVKTCFHLKWPKEACDYLKKVVECIIENESLYNITMESSTGQQVLADLIADYKSRRTLPESSGFQSLGTHTQDVILRFLGSHESLGVDIEDVPDGGVLVKDKDGMFNPNMMAEVLHAIMKDLDIHDFISFHWFDDSKDSGEARVSPYIVDVTRLSDILEKMNHLEKQIEKIIFQENEEPEERPPAP